MQTHWGLPVDVGGLHSLQAEVAGSNCSLGAASAAGCLQGWSRLTTCDVFLLFSYAASATARLTRRTSTTLQGTVIWQGKANL